MCAPGGAFSAGLNPSRQVSKECISQLLRRYALNPTPGRLGLLGIQALRRSWHGSGILWLGCRVSDSKPYKALNSRVIDYFGLKGMAFYPGAKRTGYTNKALNSRVIDDFGL